MVEAGDDHDDRLTEPPEGFTDILFSKILIFSSSYGTSFR